MWMGPYSLTAHATPASSPASPPLMDGYPVHTYTSSVAAACTAAVSATQRGGGLEKVAIVVGGGDPALLMRATRQPRIPGFPGACPP